MKSINLSRFDKTLPQTVKYGMMFISPIFDCAGIEIILLDLEIYINAMPLWIRSIWIIMDADYPEGANC